MLGLICLAAPAVNADYLDDIGYRALQLQVGAGLANGTGIRIDQVEADADSGPAIVYRADPANSGFSGVTFFDQTGDTSGLYSSHATTVALRFAGNDAITPGVSQVDNYEVTDWINAALYSDGGVNGFPALNLGVLANHSWVGATSDAASAVDLLERVDYLVDSANFVQVVGVNNTANKLLSHTLNAVTVSHTANTSTQTTAALDTAYAAGRSMHAVVAPLSSVSEATAVVTAAVALLFDASPTSNLPPEAVRALLMAGADRVTRNTTANNLVSFAATTANGHDSRYGAGQLNIQNSYTLVLGGEKASSEDGGAGGNAAGYDYDPSFGGASGSNATGNYTTGTLTTSGRLQASLAWNAQVVDQNGPGFNPARTVYNLNLQLVDTTGGGNTVVASSSSTIDTSETISAAVVAGRNYSLKVLNAHGSNFNRDYGIAWRIEADRDRDGLPDRFETGACPAVGDADSDDDGIPDGVEDANLDGVVNPGETNPCNPDTDGDGLQDGTERGITVPVPDPDDAGPLLGTDTQVFVPDADPSTTTSATLADTDGDGFSDGEEDRNRNGRVDAGESDPNHAASTPPVQPVPLPAPSLAALGFLCAAVARWRGSRQFR